MLIVNMTFQTRFEPDSAERDQISGFREKCRYFYIPFTIFLSGAHIRFT